MSLLTVDRLALLGCLTVGLIVGIFQATGAIPDPFDARLYWAADVRNLYPTEWAGGYVYPPPLAMFLSVFEPLGWPLFIVTFTTSTWAAFWYCTRALAPVVLILSILLVALIGGNVVGYLFMGNIQILMAAAIVASVRVSCVFAVFPLLTKGVGVPLIWHLVRREWRDLGIALAVAAGIVGVTFVAVPEAWADFVRFTTTNSLSASPIELVPIAFQVRLAAAIILVSWGGATNRRWTVPISAGIAIPALYQWSFLAVWIGVIGVEWPTTRRTAVDIDV